MSGTFAGSPRGSCGIALALTFAQSMKPFVYQVPPNDPWTLGLVTVTFLGVAAAASYIPARRAGRAGGPDGRSQGGVDMLQDARFALRLLNRHRGYAATAILTVALGVGANTAVFSVADSVLFRPLPFADADRLFVLRIGNPKTGQVYGMLPGPGLDAARGTGLFDVIAPVSGRSTRAYVHRAEGLDALTLSPVSREYVELLGVRAAIGRMFDASDVGTRAVVLSPQILDSQN